MDAPAEEKESVEESMGESPYYEPPKKKKSKKTADEDDYTPLFGGKE
jgi:hypothetical protein